MINMETRRKGPFTQCISMYLSHHCHHTNRTISSYSSYQYSSTALFPHMIKHTYILSITHILKKKKEKKMKRGEGFGGQDRKKSENIISRDKTMRMIWMR